MKKVLAVLAVNLALAGASLAGVTNFDDAITSDIEWGIPAGYDGLTWEGYWGVMKGTYYDPIPSGYYNGMVSPEYVAFNSRGREVRFSKEEAFYFVGASFAAGWNDGLLVEVEGYLNGDLVYSTEFTVNTTEATWMQFDWTVDEVMLISSGGTPAWQTSGAQFAMDDLTTRDALPGVPAPGAVLLASLGAGLTGWLRRRRAL